MKIRITDNIKKYIIIYIAVLLALYLVIEMVPKVTDIFETTQVLEPGSLQLTNEATGYLIKKETISISPESGSIKYLVDEGSAVRKNQKVVKIDENAEGNELLGKYEDLMQQLSGYNGVSASLRTPMSGIFSLSMDGGEQALSPDRMDSLTYKKLKDLPLHQESLRESNVNLGDPIYKVTSDSKWYVVCWLDEETASHYEPGQAVNLALPAGTVAATVRSIDKEKKRFKVIFRSDRYYKELADTREVKMTIEDSNRSGLLIDNNCLIEKNGETGVYVRDKNGDYYFVPVNVLETDGKDSVISESSFIDDEGATVYTVSVYDEVLKQPKKQLKKELRQQEKEQKKEQQKTTRKTKESTEQTTEQTTEQQTEEQKEQPTEQQTEKQTE